jgi:hypothetical protein
VGAGRFNKIESQWEYSEGIGLSTAKRLCEVFGATIENKPVPSSGTTSCILFPRNYNDYRRLS